MRLEGSPNRVDKARMARLRRGTAVLAVMVGQFRQTVLDDQSPDALDKCKRFTEGWVEVGTIVEEGRKTADKSQTAVKIE